MKTYAGIGSRETPPTVLAAMTRIAVQLSTAGYTLRSGGAVGADSAFEAGAYLKEIYLPWPRFNDNESPLHRVSPEALAIAARLHPTWLRLNKHAQLLHGRNTCQVLGGDCKTKADFVICWTKGGKGQGGTGQAIRLAQAFGIPVYDLAIWNEPVLLRRLLP